MPFAEYISIMNEEETKIFELLVEFSLMTDVEGNFLSADVAYIDDYIALIDDEILKRYFYLREGNISPEALVKFRPLFRRLSDFIGLERGYIENEPLEQVLILRSAMEFVIEDFPEISDTLSPFIYGLTELFESLAISWRLNELIENVDTYNELDELRECIPKHHTWWNILDKVEFIDSVPIEIARKRHFIHHEATYKYVEAKKIFENAQKEYHEASEICEVERNLKTNCKDILNEANAAFLTQATHLAKFNTRIQRIRNL